MLIIRAASCKTRAVCICQNALCYTGLQKIMLTNARFVPMHDIMEVDRLSMWQAPKLFECMILCRSADDYRCKPYSCSSVCCSAGLLKNIILNPAAVRMHSIMEDWLWLLTQALQLFERKKSCNITDDYCYKPYCCSNVCYYVGLWASPQLIEHTIL